MELLTCEQVLAKIIIKVVVLEFSLFKLVIPLLGEEIFIGVCVSVTTYRKI